MDLDPRHVLAAAAGIFVVFLVFRMWPGRGRGAARVASTIRAARLRAKEASSPEERAEALCDAGAAAASGRLFRASAAYFLRALRVRPAWPEGIVRASQALQSRPALLEGLLLRRLSALPWDDAHRDTIETLARSLADLYERRRDRPQAEVMRRVARLVAEKPGEKAS